MSARMPELPLSAFPEHSVVPLRYGDTDRQGHINNVVFASFCETGRVNLIKDDLPRLEQDMTQFAIVRLVVEFRRELHWPGEVTIGTGVTKLGTSSVTLRQGIFSQKVCVASGESIIVLMNMETRKAAPLPDFLRERYLGLRIVDPH
ncbi:MAG: thioesterase family protein [Pseudomonadota bacterium]